MIISVYVYQIITTGITLNININKVARVYYARPAYKVSGFAVGQYVSKKLPYILGSFFAIIYAK